MIRLLSRLLMMFGVLWITAAIARLWSRDHNVSVASVGRLVETQLRKAAKIAGSGVPMLIESYGVPNARSDGSRILYNPKWVASIVRRYRRNPRCSEALVMGAMAHELSHFFSEDGSDALQHSVDCELKADGWAGYVLGRRKLPRKDFERIIDDLSLVCGEVGAPTDLRAHAIRSGYREGLGMI